MLCTHLVCLLIVSFVDEEIFKLETRPAGRPAAAAFDEARGVGDATNFARETWSIGRGHREGSRVLWVWTWAAKNPRRGRNLRQRRSGASVVSEHQLGWVLHAKQFAVVAVTGSPQGGPASESLATSAIHQKLVPPGGPTRAVNETKPRPQGRGFSYGQAIGQQRGKRS